MRRKALLLLPLAALVSLLGAGCGGSSAAPSVPADGVAVVGSQTITRAEYAQLLAQAKRTYLAQKRAFPKAGTQEFKALSDQAVAYLVQQSELEQKAKDLGIAVTNQDVVARLGQLKQQYFGGSEQRYQQQLKQQGLTEQDVENQIRVQLLSEKLFNKVTSGATVSDKDVQAYYAQHRSQYQTPASRDVRHILVSSKALANQIYAQLKGGASFAALAKKYSKDPGSAAKGGSLGSVTQGQTVPQFDKVAFALKTGQISRPVHTQYGWHIIEPLSAIRAAKSTPLSQVSTTIRQQLLQQKKNSLMTAWITDTKKAFCKGKLSYQQGYKPLTDPCAALTTSTSATSTG